jgi:hypothetical protein
LIVAGKKYRKQGVSWHWLCQIYFYGAFPKINLSTFFAGKWYLTGAPSSRKRHEKVKTTV